MLFNIKVPPFIILSCITFSLKAFLWGISSFPCLDILKIFSCYLLHNIMYIGFKYLTFFCLSVRKMICLK